MTDFERGECPHCGVPFGLVGGRWQCEKCTPAYKAEMHTEGRWYSNAIVLATREEAEAYGRDRWTVPEDWRVVETGEPVNYRWDGRPIPVNPS